MSVKTQGTYKSSDGKTDIAYYVHTPETAPRAILQISHGMCEYFARYSEFADYMTGHGVAVCGNDHLGHGASAASENDLGYFAEKDGYLKISEDLHILHDIMRRRYRSLPYVLMGHSMGSFAARCYMSRWGGEIDGAVLSGTSGGDVPLKFALALSSLIIRFKGERYRSALLEGLSHKGYNRHFGGGSGYKWLSKEKAILDKYKDDPHCNYIFTAGAYRDMFRMLSEISSADWAASVPPSLPVFLVSGSDDPVGSRGKGVRTVYNRLIEAGVNDVRIKLYEGDRHEIINETDRENVYADILGFVSEICESVVSANTLSACLRPESPAPDQSPS